MIKGELARVKAKLRKSRLGEFLLVVFNFNYMKLWCIKGLGL